MVAVTGIIAVAKASIHQGCGRRAGCEPVWRVMCSFEHSVMTFRFRESMVCVLDNFADVCTYQLTRIADDNQRYIQFPVQPAAKRRRRPTQGNRHSFGGPTMRRDRALQL